MKYKTYPKMKDSGITGIGKIPEDWGIQKITSFCELRGRIGWKGLSTEDYRDKGPILLGVTNISKNFKLDLKKITRISQDRYDESPEIMVQKNDILLAKSGATTGKVCLVEHISEQTTTNAAVNIIRITKNKISPKFMYQFLISSIMQEILFSYSSTSAQPNLFQRDIKKISIILPNQNEQLLISKFLDIETSKIDLKILKNQKLIESLKNKKQAIIDQAVTKGLDSTVSMKDSGVEWIGNIPEHWLNSKLKFVLSLLKDGSHNPPPRTNSGIKFLSGGTDFKNSKISFEKCSFISNDDYLELHRFYELQHNDILLTIVATLGSVALVNSKDLPFSMQRSIALLRPKSIILSEFLFYFFHTNYFQNELKRRNHGAVKPGIYLEELKNIPIIHPDLISEQRQIVDYLDTQTTRIDLIISQIESQISYLNEFKQSLIFSTITGKICITN